MKLFYHLNAYFKEFEKQKSSNNNGFWDLPMCIIQQDRSWKK